jgi:hypothetical protein
MLNWVHAPHADYVLAAYGIALGALLVIGMGSWGALRRAKKILAALKYNGSDV